MTKDSVIVRIGKILNDLFDREFEVTENTVADDVDGWDSLAWLQIVSAMEAEFKMHFTFSEINSFANIGEIADSIIKHSGK